MVASRNRSDSSIRSVGERIRQEYLRKSFCPGSSPVSSGMAVDECANVWPGCRPTGGVN
jgi:hypothetical protein